MSKLRDGAHLTLWPKVVGVIEPGASPFFVSRSEGETLCQVALAAERVSTESLSDQLLLYVVEGDPLEEDPVILRRLIDLDQRYCGWIPGFWSAFGGHVEDAARMQARRRVHTVPRVARPTLPSSMIRRLQAIERSAPKTIYVEDDADGLSILLAHRAEVTVREVDPMRRQWLAGEAKRAGVQTRWRVKDTIEPESVDAACVWAGPPSRLDALWRAIRAVRPRGLVFVGVRPPWDQSLLPRLDTMGFELIDHFRDIDHHVLPGAYVVDGTADLVVYRRPDEYRSEEESTVAVSQDIRAQPYFTLDFDCLSEASMSDNPMERLLHAIEAQSDRSPAMQNITRRGDSDVGCWIDEAGYGLSAVLNRARAHLLINLVPFDIGLEYAALCAAFHTLGDDLTRARPHRTLRWKGENVLGR